MKGKQTDRTATFEIWRKNNVSNLGDFIWIQINYNANSADAISIIFEEKDDLNLNIGEIIPKLNNIQCFILNFTNNKSPYYTDGKDLHNKIGLVLAKQLYDKVDTYWDYRLKTLPQNCLTADIDSLEIAKTQFIGIEAAQLFDTMTIDRAMPHIFKTFKFRKNKVNEKQYLAQYKLMQKIGGKAFVLFHIINQNNTLSETSPVFLIENNVEFYNMLCDIKRLSDESNFIKAYQSYLVSNMKQYDNIYSAYKHIKSL